jgi:hypothetical protein
MARRLSRTTMTPKQLKAWVKYHATRGAFCPAGCDGHKFLDDQQWLLVYPGRVYFICEACALGWAGGHDVVEPDDVPAFLASRQWRRGGSGLELADGQGPLTVPEYPAVLQNEAVDLYRRLAANRCDGCGQTTHTVVFDIGRRNSRFVFSLCHPCALNGPEVDFRKLMVSKELADIVSGLYSERDASANVAMRAPVVGHA